MTSPQSILRSNWLGRYLAVENKWWDELSKVLTRAARDAKTILEKTEATETPTISTAVRSLQLKLALQAITKNNKELFGTTGKLIKQYQGQAAQAAVDAALFNERSVLAKLFPKPSDRNLYAQSLRETAQRNVEAVITRNLFTDIPLSEKVWKTRALANGLVSRAVNNGLARGDSAKSIAEAVAHLIRPDTPGGVSYAAKRLGRTEIHNAFHAQSIQDTLDKPWVDQVEWHLSKVHKNDPDDPCEDYAKVRYFPKGHAPIPPHPNCLCFITPVNLAYDQFETALVSGQYDQYLDSVMGEGYAAQQAVEGGPMPAPQNEVVFYQPGLKETVSSATAPEQVARIMMQKYPQVNFADWNANNTTLTAAKQYALALDDMMTKYPGHGLEVVSFGDNNPIEYGRTYSSYQTNRSAIVFNRLYALNPDYTYEKMANDVATNYHVLRSDEQPYYATAVHEFGHVLDGQTQFVLEDAAERGLVDHFAANPEGFNPDGSGFMDWLHSHVVDYCFGYEGEPSYTEMIAESFADVELNGSKAGLVSKMLNDWLMTLVNAK